MKIIIFFLLLSGLISTNCKGQRSPQSVEGTQIIVASTSPVDSYQEKLQAIESQRLHLAREYADSADKKEVLEKSRKLFVAAIDHGVFPFWYGTDWDFYGTTETPKQGKIACGYFVTTVLRDVGVKVQRVSLAQQASENIIKSLTSEPYIKRFRNVAIEKFVEDIKAFGEGFYIVGLDNHVGFILNDGNDVYFVHSSYVEPSEVIKEKALTSPVLSSSKYRVIGKISADNSFLRKWLNQSNFPTLTR